MMKSEDKSSKETSINLFRYENITLIKVQHIISIKLTNFEESMGLCSSFYLISRGNHLYIYLTGEKRTYFVSI